MNNETNQSEKMKVTIDLNTLNLLAYVERRLENLATEYKEVHSHLETMDAALTTNAVNHIITLSAKHKVLLDIQGRIKHGGDSAQDLLEDYTQEITQRAFSITSRSTNPVINYLDDILLAEKATWLDTFKMYAKK